MAQGTDNAAEGGWTPARSVAGNRNPWTIIGVISIATFMVVLDTSIANVALAHIAGGLAASYDESTWVVTSFLVANAIIIPISGWLSDVIGRKRYYMISIALFTFSSLLCGLSQSLAFLVMARILQGIGGGGLVPVEQSMMADTFPPSKRGAAFAAYGVVVIVGPVLGPSLGGWITDNFSWHWVFLINVPVGLLSLFLVNIFVDEPAALKRHREQTTKNGFNVDFLGFLLVALLLGCLEVTLDRGQRDDWFSSNLITSCALISALSLIIFIPWEITRKNPIVNIRLYGQRNFAIANVFMLLMGVIVFGTTQFIPQFLQEVMGYTATDAGLALTAGGIATLISMPLVGFLSSRVDARYLIGFALLVQGIALWNMSTLNTQITFSNAAIARLIQSIGLPFLFVPITSAAYVGLKSRDVSQASALLNVSRNLGGTLGISFAQTMLLRRSQFHQAQYVETLNPLHPNYTPYLDRLSHLLIQHGVPPPSALHAAMAQLYRELLQQSAMLSYIDVFRVLMWFVFATLPLVILMQKPKQGSAASSAA